MQNTSCGISACCCSAWTSEASIQDSIRAYLEAVGEVALAQAQARVVAGAGQAVVLLADQRVDGVRVAAQRLGAPVWDDLPEDVLLARVQA